MDPIRIGLLVVALPAATAVAVGLAARRWRHAGAAAIAAAGVAGSWAVLGAPDAWPLAVTDRFGHLLVAGLIAAVAGTATRSGRVAVAALAAAAVAAVLGPLFAHRLAGAAGLAAAAIAALALLAVGFGLRRAGARDDRVGLVHAGLAIAAASAAAGLSGSLVIAQLGGAVAAGVGGLWLVSLRHRGRLAASAAPVIAVATWAVVAMAVLYASMSGWTAALAIALAAVPAVPARRALPGLAAATALAAALVLSAVVPSPGGDGGGDEYGYGYE